MTTATYTLEGNTYPIRFNWNAISNFLKLFDLPLKAIDNLGEMNGDQVLALIFYAFQSGCRKDGVEWPHTIESLGDTLTVRDVTALIGIYTMQTTADVQAAKKK